MRFNMSLSLELSLENSVIISVEIRDVHDCQANKKLLFFFSNFVPPFLAQHTVQSNDISCLNYTWLCVQCALNSVMRTSSVNQSINLSNHQTNMDNKTSNQSINHWINRWTRFKAAAKFVPTRYDQSRSWIKLTTTITDHSGSYKTILSKQNRLLWPCTYFPEFTWSSGQWLENKKNHSFSVWKLRS